MESIIFYILIFIRNTEGAIPDIPEIQTLVILVVYHLSRQSSNHRSLALLRHEALHDELVGAWVLTAVIRDGRGNGFLVLRFREDLPKKKSFWNIYDRYSKMIVTI